jgi:hypothetical protein
LPAPRSLSASGDIGCTAPPAMAGAFWRGRLEVLLFSRAEANAASTGTGWVAERLKAPVLKPAGAQVLRGFESHPSAVASRRAQPGPSGSRPFRVFTRLVSQSHIEAFLQTFSTRCTFSMCQQGITYGGHDVSVFAGLNGGARHGWGDIHNAGLEANKEPQDYPQHERQPGS